MDDYPPKVAPYTTRAPDGLKRDAAKLGTAVGEFAERLFNGDHPWAKIRQGHKLLRLAVKGGETTYRAGGPIAWFGRRKTVPPVVLHSADIQLMEGVMDVFI